MSGARTASTEAGIRRRGFAFGRRDEWYAAAVHLRSRELLARVVILDPELTVGLPAKLTAATGADALTHCIESYTCPSFHPMCDGIALEGLRLGAANLHRAVANPTDLDARGAMLMSSMMGAIAFQKDLGAVHSCAHALSTVADLHHGLANGVMIDHVMAFNLPSAVAKMAELARVCGAKGGDSGSVESRAASFLLWLKDLKAVVGIPARLSGLTGGRPVTRADLGEYLIARGGYEKLEALLNVRIVTGEAAKRNVTVSAEEVEAELEVIAKDLQVTKADFIKTLLPKAKKSYAEYVEDEVRPRLLLGKMVKDKITVGDDDLRKAFERTYGEKRKAQIILWSPGQFRLDLEPGQDATLVLSTDPAHSLADAVGLPIGTEPTELDALRANSRNTDPTRRVRFLPYGIGVSVLDAPEQSGPPQDDQTARHEPY